jgi:hypothetical protein
VKDSRSTQRGKIFELLRSRGGQWVSLPEILQFGARIYELRRNGCTILNKTEHRDGKVLSWYRLESGPTRPEPRSLPATITETGTLFPRNDSQVYRDPEEEWR